jgi:RNA polymerase-interacting CarD/CdnL/TRCF family regulator
MSHYGPPPGWGGWGWGRPTPEEEKEYLDDYIEMLKEELAAAEEYRKELAGSE